MILVRETYELLINEFCMTFITMSLDVKRCAPKLLARLKCESKVKTTKELKIGARSLAHNIFEVRGACWNFGMGLGRMTSIYSLTQTCTKPNNKLVSALLEHF
jgi:hypothetical protein